jgi:hypothetical protein
MVGIAGQIDGLVVEGISLGGFSSQANQVIAAESFCRLDLSISFRFVKMRRAFIFKRRGTN